MGMRLLSNGNYEIKNKRTGETKEVSAADLPNYGLTAPEEKTSFLDKLGGFISSAGTRIGKESGVGLALRGKTTTQARESAEQAFAMSRKLIEQAKLETDPEKKSRLLEASRQADQNIGGAVEEITPTAKDVGFEEEADLEEFLKGGTKSYVKQAAQAAVQIGAWMAPAGSAKAGIQLTKKASILAGKGVVKSGVRGVVSGGATGALFDLGSDDPGFKAAPTSALFSGALSVGGPAFRKIYSVMVDSLPKTLRAKNLMLFNAMTGKDKWKQAKEMAERSLEEGMPTDLNKVGSWADDILTKSQKELDKVGGDVIFKIDDVFTSDSRKQKFAIKTISDTAKSLRDQGKFDKADELLEVAREASKQGGFSFKNLMTIKKRVDEVAQSSFGKAVGEIQSNKLAGTRVVGDRVRDYLRNNDQVGTQTRELLDTQRFAIILKDAADPALKRIREAMIPSWWEIAAVTGPLAFGQPLAAIPSIGAVTLARLFQLPSTSQKLFDVGKKGAKIGAKIPTGTAENLKSFLVKGLASQASQ